MFGDFIKRLTEPSPAPLPDEDARLALTALLVRVARADHDYAASERARIQRIVTARYGLAQDQVADLLASAEAFEAEAPDTVRFTRAIKDAVPYFDRQAVLEAMWSVVLADGVRSHDEDALLRLVSNLLGITDQDSAKARHKAEDKV